MTSLNAAPARRPASRPARAASAFALDRLEARSHLTAASGSIDFNAGRQTIEGLGSAPIVWEQPAEYLQASFYDGLVNDLGASGVRGPIWADLEGQNDDDDPNHFNWANFKGEHLGRTLQFFQRMKERGVEEFFLSSWTPPHWMKTNRALNGGGGLRHDMREEFAEFLAGAVIVAKRDYGIELAGVSVQNEQFFIEPYESAVMDEVMLRETVIAVQKKFAREGLTTKVIANEDGGFYDNQRWEWYNRALLDSPEIDRSRLIIGSHITNNDVMHRQAQQLAGTGVPLWYTESSSKPADWGGAMSTAVEMSDVFTRAGATSFYYWLYDADSWAAHPTATLMNDGVPNAKYHAFKHFSKFVRPGMQRVETRVDESTGARLSAYQDKAKGSRTVVLMNDSAGAVDYTINLSGLGKLASFDAYRSTENNYWTALGKLAGTGSASNGTLTISLPARSIVTLYDGPAIAPVTGRGSVALPSGPLTDMTSGTTQTDYLRREAYNGDVAAVKQRLTYLTPAEINRPDANGWTPLHAAAASVYWVGPEVGWRAVANPPAVVEALLAAGASATAVTDEGFTPLHVAAMNQFIEYPGRASLKSEIANQLINAGAPVNGVDAKGRTALHWSALTNAAFGGGYYNGSMPFTLLGRGADKTLLDAAGRSAYDYAMQEHKDVFADVLKGPGLDTVAPRARLAAYRREENEIALSITENVTATLAAGDVQLVNLTSGQALTGGWSLATPKFASGLTVARLTFAGRLPDGQYRMTIPAGTFADQSGVASTEPVVVTFNVLTGDADGNDRVDFNDLLVLARNYGKQSTRLADGDFNGDGVVNFDDLLALARNYNKSAVPIG